MVTSDVADDSVASNLCMRELTNYTVYTASPGLCYRYRLLPGRYLLLPNYVTDNESVKRQQQNVVRQFCVRVFTAADISCRYLIISSLLLIDTVSSCMRFDISS